MGGAAKFLLPITELLSADLWPDDYPFPDGKESQDALSEVYFTDYELISSRNGIQFQTTILITEEISVGIPGFEGVELVLGGNVGEAVSSFLLSAFVGESGFELRADDIEIALRFPPSILRPVAETEGSDPPSYAEITVRGGISLDQNLDFTFDGFDRISLAPVMIGTSGIIISADNVLLDLSRTETIPEVLDAGFDESFIGVFIGEAQVKLPHGLPELAPEKLVLRNAAIGSGGVSGRLEAVYSFSFDAASKTYTGDGGGELFGVPFGVSSVALDLKQNAFQESGVTGELLFPFFEKRLNVAVGINLDGSLSAKLTGVAEAGDSFDPETGLFSLRKGNIFEIEVDSISFELQDDVFITKLSGRITPLLGSLGWPSFQVNELAIDSEGNVHLEGGWLDLREQHSLNFHGFQMEITKLGFGKSEDGGKWIGFSGGLKLVDGLSAGASVEGLRITWYEDETGEIVTELTLDGVGVEFEVPDVLRFKGAVNYDDAANEFAGDIKLDLISLNLQVDGKLVIGQQDGESYMAIYLGVELPSGIPLWSTGLALYGMAGLFALRMEPDKREDQEWYGIDDESSWYHSGTTPGVTDLTKWKAAPGSLALGAGVTIGTISDNGYAFSGKMLLVFGFPGPFALIQGKANILKERAKLTTEEESAFRALAVLDNRAGTFLIGVDAQYKFDRNGKLIDIRAGAEAFFDFDDPSLWHIYLGEREPREKRIRAEIFRLFQANAYFMLDANELAMGAWVGFDEDWKFGPLRVEVEAWIEGNAIISWKPTHYFGELWLHGKAELSVFGFGTALTVDARFPSDVFDPFHILGLFTVEICLPWPLGCFGKDITLEWGPDPTPPPLPLPLKEIAIEHFKVTTSWPLPAWHLVATELRFRWERISSGPARAKSHSTSGMDTS